MKPIQPNKNNSSVDHDHMAGITQKEYPELPLSVKLGIVVPAAMY
jgi:hypothetical protein